MMDSQLKRSLLWGLVGAFSFLVLLQAYELLTRRLVDWPVKIGMAVVVLVGATVLTYAANRATGNEATGNEQA